MKNFFLLALTIITWSTVYAQKLIPVAEAWAGNSVNAVVFRKNSIVTHGKTQFTAFYNQQGKLVLAKRALNARKWEISETQYSGNIRDAHNTISIMTDGDGFLHISWDHHGHKLNYVRSVAPLSLQLTEKMPMTGKFENNVTYPEFFRMPNGNLIFMYRDGQSGRGNLVLNAYDLQTREWTQLQSNLIDGEKKQNAYWQACVDKVGDIHLSWVWRATPDVSTNHSMCYARSKDGGKTWEKSTGEIYSLPINAGSAEYALRIPQRSELINQTSMTTDDQGNPFIATYWRDADSEIPQYRIIYNLNGKWKTNNTGFRTNAFSLSGGGTKSIPIARPQILVKGKSEKAKVTLIFRDSERHSKVSIASCCSLQKNLWKITDLTDFSVNAWEPSYDTELWKKKSKLHLFVQKVNQIDGEGVAASKPEIVYILETK
jgi:hypothetical protein